MAYVSALASIVSYVARTRTSPNFEDWSVIRAGAGTGAGTGHPIVAVRFDGGTSGYPNKWASLYRLIAVFNLSFLAGISPADVYAADVDMTTWDYIDYLGATPNSNLYDATPASYTSIVASDFQNIGSTPMMDDVGTYPYILGIGAMNAAGVGWLQSHMAGGYVAFGVRNVQYDVNDVAPPWAAQSWSYKRTYGGSSSYRAKLTVYYYTLPSVGVMSPYVDVETMKATLRGNLNDTGGASCEVRFRYGEGTLDHETDWVSHGLGEFQSEIDIEPNKSYLYRAEARNFKGTVWAGDIAFDTYKYRDYYGGSLMWANWPRPGGVKLNIPASGLVVVTKEAASFGPNSESNIVFGWFEPTYHDLRGVITIGGLLTERVTTVTATTAVLNAMVTASQYGQIAFEYGLTTAYGTTTPWQPTVPDPAGDHHSWGIYGLTEGQLYHVRAVWRVKTDDTYSYQYGNDVVFVATSKNLYLVTSYPSVLKIGAGAIEKRGKQTMEDISYYVWSIGAHKQYPFIGIYSTPAEVARIEKSRFKGTTTMQGYAYYLSLGGEIAADLKIQTREAK